MWYFVVLGVSKPYEHTSQGKTEWELIVDYCFEVPLVTEADMAKKMRRQYYSRIGRNSVLFTDCLHHSTRMSCSHLRWEWHNHIRDVTQ